MRVGLDIGSTTIKCVVLNDAGQIVYSTYERHFSHILEKGRALLEKVAAEYLPDGRAYLAISGSAGMGLPVWPPTGWPPAPTASSSWAARTPKSFS